MWARSAAVMAEEGGEGGEEGEGGVSEREAAEATTTEIGEEGPPRRRRRSKSAVVFDPLSLSETPEDLRALGPEGQARGGIATALEGAAVRWNCISVDEKVEIRREGVIGLACTHFSIRFLFPIPLLFKPPWPHTKETAPKPARPRRGRETTPMISSLEAAPLRTRQESERKRAAATTTPTSITSTTTTTFLLLRHPRPPSSASNPPRRPSPRLPRSRPRETKRSVRVPLMRRWLLTGGRWISSGTRSNKRTTGRREAKKMTRRRTKKTTKTKTKAKTTTRATSLSSGGAPPPRAWRPRSPSSPRRGPRKPWRRGRGPASGSSPRRSRGPAWPGRST